MESQTWWTLFWKAEELVHATIEGLYNIYIYSREMSRLSLSRDVRSIMRSSRLYLNVPGVSVGTLQPGCTNSWTTYLPDFGVPRACHRWVRNFCQFGLTGLQAHSGFGLPLCLGMCLDKLS